MEILNAVSVGEVTLVGFMPDERPQPFGNCFSVHLQTGGDAKIVNFNYENLEALLKQHGLTWPIKIGVLGVNKFGHRIAVIHDERIDDRWYQMRFCEACCPDELLPITQLLQHEREEAAGIRTVVGIGVVYDFTKQAQCGALPRYSGPLDFMAVEMPGVTLGSTAGLAKVDFK